MNGWCLHSQRRREDDRVAMILNVTINIKHQNCKQKLQITFQFAENISIRDMSTMAETG